MPMPGSYYRVLSILITVYCNMIVSFYILQKGQMSLKEVKQVRSQRISSHFGLSRSKE